MPRNLLWLLLAGCLPLAADAADLDAAFSLRDKLRDKVTGLRVRADWSEDGKFLKYSLRPAPRDGGDSRRIDLSTGESVVVGGEEANHRRRLEWQAPGAVRSSGASREETEVRFVNESTNTVMLFWITTGGERQGYGSVAPGQTHAQHTFAGHAWLVTDTDEQGIAGLVAEADPGVAVISDDLHLEAKKEEKDLHPRAKAPRGVSPDGHWRILFKDHNARLVAVDDDRDPRVLTEDGVQGDAYRGPAHWSPDSRWVVLNRHRDGQERRVEMIDSAPDDQVQPRLVSYEYRKPGDAIPRDRPVLFRIPDGERIEPDDELFANPWQLHAWHWKPDSSEVFFEYNQRGHQVYRMLAIRPSDGRVRVVAEEESDTFVNYSNKIDGRHLDATDRLLWMSERDGWNHLYLIDRVTGEVVRQLTEGEWVVRGIERLDEEAGQVWFRMMGYDADQDPYHVHYARISLDGTGFTRLTEGNGTHGLEFGPDRGYYIDTWSRTDQPPVHELRRGSDGSLVLELGRADTAALREAGWVAPEPFVAKGRDGATDIWGVIFRPTHFDPSDSYPVIEQIYAGPHDHHVPKRFAAYRNAQALAELGFVVVQIDGMGTNWRSKSFHDVAWKNLKDAGFPDRIAWMKAAAARYPCMDLSRVGIYGGSAGGQNAMRAVLDHHDVYRAAAADCGCHDNRMDKIWWNEAWMGWPVDESYAENSNVEDAHRLGGALLLTVGELDRNVDPASTMQVVSALIEADKDFELIVFPGRGHGAGGGRYGQRRMYEFFVRHLAGD